MTPLHLAAGKGNFDAVRYLVDSGADFNIKQQHGVNEWSTLIYYHLQTMIISHVQQHEIATIVNPLTLALCIGFQIAYKNPSSSLPLLERDGKVL